MGPVCCDKPCNSIHEGVPASAGISMLIGGITGSCDAIPPWKEDDLFGALALLQGVQLGSAVRLFERHTRCGALPSPRLGRSVTVRNADRPETWVTFRAGHMGNTFRPSAGERHAVESEFGNAGASQIRRPTAFGSSASCLMALATSTWSRRPCNPWKPFGPRLLQPICPVRPVT